MQKYLIFQIYGILQSWGDTAVGEIRPGSRHPTKSAILGLLAGALGVTRERDEEHARMAESYSVAIRQDISGTLTRDYHTVQTASAKKDRLYQCRSDLLNGMLNPGEDLHTIISYRDYLMDSCFGVCVWGKVDNLPYQLSELAQALRQPVFVPYLGRKSCPPGLPFNPQVVENENLKDALSMLPIDGKIAEALVDGSKDTVELTWDIDTNIGIQQLRVESSRDIPTSRRRWQFESREKNVGIISFPIHKEWK